MDDLKCQMDEFIAECEQPPKAAAGPMVGGFFGNLMGKLREVVAGLRSGGMSLAAIGEWLPTIIKYLIEHGPELLALITTILNLFKAGKGPAELETVEFPA